MSVLVHLVRAGGRIVHKDELKNEIWGSIYVVDEAVQRCISQIRSLLGDDYKQPRYIETVQKRGYRVIGASAARSGFQKSIAAAVFACIFLVLPSGEQPAISASVVASQANLTQRYQNGIEFYENAQSLDNESAIEIFRQIIAEDPEFSVAHSSLAEALARKRLRWSKDDELLSEAMIEAKLAIDLSPTAAHGYKALGLVYQASWQYAEALEMYELALERYPGFTSAIINAAVIYTDLGYYNMALDMLEQAPGTMRPVAIAGLRGLVNMHLGNRTESAKWYRRVLELSPLSSGAVTGLAKIMLLEGQFDQSLSQCAKLLDMNPRHVSCLMDSGLASLVGGDHEAAAGYYSRFPRGSKHPRALEALTRLAYIQYLESGDVAALEELRDQLLSEIVHIEQTNYPRAHSLALLSAILGDKAEAMVWITRAAAKSTLYHEWALVDPAYSNLHTDSDFSRFIEQENRRLNNRADCTRQTCLSGAKVAANMNY